MSKGSARRQGTGYEEGWDSLFGKYSNICHPCNKEFISVKEARVCSSCINKFKLNQQVKHIKTGNTYVIVELPNPRKLLEYCNEPYYTYREFSLEDSVYWVRSKSEMEDGRFE